MPITGVRASCVPNTMGGTIRGCNLSPRTDTAPWASQSETAGQAPMTNATRPQQESATEGIHKQVKEIDLHKQKKNAIVQT